MQLVKVYDESWKSYSFYPLQNLIKIYSDRMNNHITCVSFVMGNGREVVHASSLTLEETALALSSDKKIIELS